ncbi:pentatricopeptide repeat-containing protein At3g29230-like [Asparagus officinalis]|uniref:pentatricopeptide repeat-containing protein At3g29230-like n=1 Tax=Asparagus officinalis TaxID=4686 RepID=UPI00098DEAAD|nr:pentatricopeptide repeat-containing protein At3g29230-like [Asparagus officinalis]
MSSSSFLKLFSQNPLQPSLKNAKSTLQILQIHAQSITNPNLSHSSSSHSCLLFALSQLPFPNPSSSYINLIFSQIQKPGTFIYNTVIRLHSKASNPLHSIRFFVEMKRNGVKSDNFTYPFVLTASSLISDQKLAMLIHGEVFKTGFDSDLFVVNGLISCYYRSREIDLAREVFDGCKCKDLVSWNSMISGYVNCGEVGEAQKLFDEMPKRDAFTWAILVDAYVKIDCNINRARKLFDQIIEKDLVCWNSMINGYSRVGDMSSAKELFEAMPKRNEVSWSIIIDGYARHGNSKEALQTFYRMLHQGTRPDRVCAVGAITACAQLGALDQGQWIHSYLRRHKILLDVVVNTSLVDMYMKCGSLDLARRVFEGMRAKSVVSWNVMIVGLGTNGRGVEALELFYHMLKQGAPMDDLTFLGVLTACTHTGLVDEGFDIFHRMKNEFGSEPKIEHYGCIVDLLGRSGRLEEARIFIETMPMEPTPALWVSLLASCRTHRCVDLAEKVVDELVRIGEDDGGVYVLMSNIYADEGMWTDVWRMRRLMKGRGMKKETGRSVIELDGVVHEFVNGDCLHSCKEWIYDVARRLSNEMVFVR